MIYIYISQLGMDTVQKDYYEDTWVTFSYFGMRGRKLRLSYFAPSFSSKLRREELEHLRREVDQLKTHLSESHAKNTYSMPLHWSCGSLHVLSSVLACQAKGKCSLAHRVGSFFSLTGRREEDVFLQQAEDRETRIQYERSCKVNTHIVSCRSCLLVWICGL